MKQRNQVLHTFKKLSITHIHSFAGIAYTIKQQEQIHDWFALASDSHGLMWLAAVYYNDLLQIMIKIKWCLDATPSHIHTQSWVKPWI